MQNVKSSVDLKVSQLDIAGVFYGHENKGTGSGPMMSILNQQKSAKVTARVTTAHDSASAVTVSAMICNVKVHSLTSRQILPRAIIKKVVILSAVDSAHSLLVAEPV